MAEKKNPLKITDLTFRDGHQSLFATRVRTDDLTAIAPEMDKVGFWSMEMWGGATFDVMTRFLNEDPWERVRLLKKLMPNTRLQMLLRGQNLVGYRNYADDVVEAFVEHAARTGIDIFRVFDALNDERNFQTALKAIKKAGKHAQLSICYSLTERKMGGPVFNLDYYLQKARTFQEMGADSLCIKDMAGLISPDDTYTLIKALKQELKIPVQLHSHYTSGLAPMSFIKAIEAGVDIIDAALAPFALRTSHPAVEPIVVALQDTDRDTGIKLNKLLKLGQYFETIAPKYRDFIAKTKMSVIDTGVLMHQVPGGMISNLVSQLKEANALDRINEVYAELPRVRKELGYPPLVTPTSQIVGIQAVQNVLFGRYKVISAQVKDYVYGLYGRPPVPVDPEIQRIVLNGYDKGETPITERPGDVLEPEMDAAFKATEGIAKDIGDVLTYAVYPTTGMRFLKWKYGLEEAPPETKPRTMEDIKREDEIIARVKAGMLAEKQPAAEPVKAADPVEEKAPPDGAQDDGTAVVAPMPGLIIRFEVKVGDKVKTGDNIAVLEAMKMAIDLPSPVDGTIKSINYKDGDNVARDDVLAVIG